MSLVFVFATTTRQMEKTCLVPFNATALKQKLAPSVLDRWATTFNNSTKTTNVIMLKNAMRTTARQRAGNKRHSMRHLQSGGNNDNSDCTMNPCCHDRSRKRKWLRNIKLFICMDCTIHDCSKCAACVHQYVGNDCGPYAVPRRLCTRHTQGLRRGSYPNCASSAPAAVGSLSVLTSVASLHVWSDSTRSAPFREWAFLLQYV